MVIFEIERFTGYPEWPAATPEKGEETPHFYDFRTNCFVLELKGDKVTIGPGRTIFSGLFETLVWIILVTITKTRLFIPDHRESSNIESGIRSYAH
jgi:hypothetical protein